MQRMTPMSDPDRYWKAPYGDNWAAEKAAFAKFLRDYNEKATVLDRNFDKMDEEYDIWRNSDE